MLYLRSPELFHLITESLYLLTNISPFPPPPWLRPLETTLLLSVSVSGNEALTETCCNTVEHCNRWEANHRDLGGCESTYMKCPEKKSIETERLVVAIKCTRDHVGVREIGLWRRLHSSKFTKIHWIQYLKEVNFVLYNDTNMLERGFLYRTGRGELSSGSHSTWVGAVRAIGGPNFSW